MHSHYQLNIVECHKCEMRDRSQMVDLRCYDGVPLGDHARRGDCPAGKFSTLDAAMPEPQPTRRIRGCCDPSTRADDGPTVMVNPPTEHRPVKRLPQAPR
jgi:hypothetical protein